MLGIAPEPINAIDSISKRESPFGNMIADAMRVGTNADVALITSIALDHTEFLGNDREAIGREKAGVMRPGRPVIVSDPQPPASLQACADDLLSTWGLDWRAHQTMTRRAMPATPAILPGASW